MESLDDRYLEVMGHADEAIERARLTLEGDLLDPDEINEKAIEAANWHRRAESRPGRLVGARALSGGRVPRAFRSDLG